MILDDKATICAKEWRMLLFLIFVLLASTRFFSIPAQCYIQGLLTICRPNDSLICPPSCSHVGGLRCIDKLLASLAKLSVEYADPIAALIFRHHAVIL